MSLDQSDPASTLSLRSSLMSGPVLPVVTVRLLGLEMWHISTKRGILTDNIGMSSYFLEDYFLAHAFARSTLRENSMLVMPSAKPRACVIHGESSSDAGRDSDLFSASAIEFVGSPSNPAG